VAGGTSTGSRGGRGQLASKGSAPSDIRQRSHHPRTSRTTPTLTREMRPSPTPCEFIAPSFDTLALPIRPLHLTNPSNVIHPGRHGPSRPYQVSFQLPHAHRPCPRRRPAVGPPPQPWAARPGLPGRSRKGGPARSGGPPFLAKPRREPKESPEGGAAACCPPRINRPEINT
jgi:hypothetical protein